MNPLVYHVVSGHAFFTGIALLVLAAISSTQSRPAFARVTGVAFLIGVIAVATSSTAISYWIYGIAVLLTALWAASRFRKPWRRWAPYGMIAGWLIAAGVEIPFHVTPSVEPVSARAVTIIGDSVTAGVGGDETSERWPSLLAREHKLNVQDISHMGETAASALKRAKMHEISAPLVIVEIGGNDVLGSTSAAQFAIDLDALLSHLVAENRHIVMFTLPLPPFYHEYGRVQRDIAARYNVALIPKRVFLSVIAGGDSTLDSIHLSQSGHQSMADQVWQLVGPAFVD